MKITLLKLPQAEDFDEIIEYDPANTFASYSYAEGLSDLAHKAAQAEPAAHWQWLGWELFVPVHPGMQNMFDVKRMADNLIGIKFEQEQLEIISALEEGSKNVRYKRQEDIVKSKLQVAENFYNSFEQAEIGLTGIAPRPLDQKQAKASIA